VWGTNYFVYSTTLQCQAAVPTKKARTKAKIYVLFIIDVIAFSDKIDDIPPFPPLVYLYMYVFLDNT
jgi:hypothetical protein